MGWRADVRRWLLDTSVLVAFERQTLEPERIFAAEDDVAISVITVSELLVGVSRADVGRRANRSATVEGIIAGLNVEEITVAIARINAALTAESVSQGLTRGAHDLLIAATASATKRTLVTTDEKAQFDSLTGVSAWVVKPSGD